MEPTWWALLLKPFIGIVYVALLLGAARLLAELLWRVLPDSRVKRVLFDGWKGRRAQRAARGGQRVLDHTPIVGRDSRE